MPMSPVRAPSPDDTSAMWRFPGPWHDSQLIASVVKRVDHLPPTESYASEICEPWHA
jgi:hypothetical protein